MIVGGRGDVLDESNNLIWIFNAASGKKLQEIKLAHPSVYEGMAAAYGCLFVSSADGSVMCFGSTAKSKGER